MSNETKPPGEYVLYAEFHTPCPNCGHGTTVRRKANQDTESPSGTCFGCGKWVAWVWRGNFPAMGGEYIATNHQDWMLVGGGQ